ncbi:MAG TPA: DUF2309 domain-containing protein, partial [Planctomycetaceae bacterium]|nr:DUF2309 domain-containing protein [Planctomycetaceae bacterium]
ITKFAFLNPLQGLEAEHFDDVMRRVGDIYGNEAYLDDSQYRQELLSGRIDERDLREVLAEDLGGRADEPVAGLTPRLELRLAMLIYPLHFGQRRELDWVLAETDAIKRFRPEVSPEIKRAVMDDVKDGEPLSDGDREANYLLRLWHVIQEGVDSAELTFPAMATTRDHASHRIAEFRAAMIDRRVDELMFRFTSAYLDQGYAPNPLPGAGLGFWASFCKLFGVRSRLAPRWRRSLASEIESIQRDGLSSLEVIAQSLDRMSIAPNDVDSYLTAILLSIRGFAGMIWQTETRPDLFKKSSPPGTLVEFVAVRILLLRLASDLPYEEDSDTSSLISSGSARVALLQADPEQLAFLLFEIAQILQWTPKQLASLDVNQWAALRDELHAFCDHQRRKIFHAAFERRIAKMSLHAIGTRALSPPTHPAAPSMQLVCCIDAREESLRRHLEELDPTVETFGIAGFFGVSMYYRGAGDAGFSALCPIVMKPQHWVIEEAVYSLEESDRNRARARRWIGTAQQRFQAESRRSVGGAVVSTLVGPLATIPMLSRILFPRITALMNRTATQFIAPPAITRLRLERSDDCPASPPNHHGYDGVGFTLKEMAQIAEKALRDIGLTTTFAPLVILMGHGSGCVNNPHESAYHCGACAGNSGGPNARALAVMLNDSRVRQRLAVSGLMIPEETYFIGAHHNTATEEMMFYDMELLPTRKVKHVRAVRRLLGEAARRNAHERCRRFESADLQITPDEALLHVQNRSEDLAQTRPEYGNGSNAICFVGRRSRVRGLYLDRRSFLMSYDPTEDNSESAILARIMSAVVPVCQGINSLYSLSVIDPIGWGSGTKLPHNITSLIGVMDGAASDLRSGLPWQGVDIHEPVRLLFIIESTPRAILKIMAENPVIDRIFRNHWAHVATLDPLTSEMHRFSKDKFVNHPIDSNDSENRLPVTDGSRCWYQGRRDHLPFAIIRPSHSASSHSASSTDSDNHDRWSSAVPS